MGSRAWGDFDLDDAVRSGVPVKAVECVVNPAPSSFDPRLLG